MSAHTPGPWLFRGKSNSVYTAPPAGSVYTYGSIIFSFHDVAEPSDADLALVLASPDLLKALERLRSWGAAMAGGMGIEYSGDHPIAVADAVIAKARGES